MLPPQMFVERCRRWTRIADALEGHPQRDALFQAIQDIDHLYSVELTELVEGAHANALAAGALERERLRESLAAQQERLDQALAAMVTPPTAASAEIFH